MRGLWKRPWSPSAGQFRVYFDLLVLRLLLSLTHALTFPPTLNTEHFKIFYQVSASLVEMCNKTLMKSLGYKQ